MPTAPDAQTWTDSHQLLKALGSIRDSGRAVWHWLSSLAWYWQPLIMAASGLGLFICGVIAIGQSRSRRPEARWRSQYVRRQNRWESRYVHCGVAALGVLCLVVFLLAAYQLLKGLGKIFILLHPNEWAWYWQLLIFVLLCATGLLAAIFAKWGSEGHRIRRAALLGFCVLVAIPCTLITCRFLKATYQVVIPRIDLLPIGVSAAIALGGSLIANRVDKSAYSRATSHEWRFVRGGHYKDATKRDVWEHYHGTKSWETRIRRQRVIWVSFAAIVGVLIVTNHNPTQELSVIGVTGGASLILSSVVMAVFRR